MPALRTTAALAALLVLCTITPSQADVPIGSNPKVPLSFNRLYDYPQLVDAMRSLAEAHPDLLKLHSIGKSVEGRDLWCLTLNNPKTGSEAHKAAMYVDGNIHGNEVQGGEACLYLAWYLTENYGKVDRVTKLVDERVFYIIPTVNPDGRAHWFDNPNTTHSSRGGKAPLDDDRDGVADEDGYDDLDGDGSITMMRRKDPNGRFRVDPADPQGLIPAKPDQQGEYELLGPEGIDNDGDGDVNEDLPGGYDMNRNFPADWQPPHVQFGAGPYPLCWPETRAMADFVRAHPNVAGVQAFHNFGGMILRGPGHPTREGEYPREDERVAAQIGDIGQKMLPFYKSMIIYKDLYGVHGGFVNWTYEHEGIFSFTNELYNSGQLLGQLGNAGAPADSGVSGDSEREARERLLLGSNVVAWHPVKHPTYGEIEVGGTIKQSQRVPPMFLLEELCHRNAAFVLYHADQMPLVVWEDVSAEKLGPETYSVTASVRNTRLIPSRSAQATRRKVGLPDELRIEGDDVEVVAGGRLLDRHTGQVEPVELEPSRLRIESGVGTEPVRVRWFVRGKGKAEVVFQSEKGGRLTKEITLD